MKQQELEKKIKEAQEAYYNDKPIMSDVEFDQLWDQLKKEYPDSELLNEVGTDHFDGFVKVKHKIIMGSQDKANTAEEMDKWFDKCREEGEEFVIDTEKLDGCSIELEYKDGELENGITRGDGVEGDLITLNVMKMSNYPKTLKEEFTGIIRGEVMLHRSVKPIAAPDKKNCRNATAGIMKRLDGEGCKYLTIKAYDVREEGKHKFRNASDMLDWLKEQGFAVPKYHIRSLKELNGQKALKIMEDTIFQDRDYDIDGIVWKTQVINYEDLETNYRPKFNIALKPKYTLATTKILDIEWSLKNGTLTPVAIVEPCELCGTTVKRASMANPSLMEDMGIEIGHEVLITKCGEIIPGILKDLTTGKSRDGYIFE